MGISGGITAAGLSYIDMWRDDPGDGPVRMAGFFQGTEESHEKRREFFGSLRIGRSAVRRRPDACIEKAFFDPLPVEAEPFTIKKNILMEFSNQVNNLFPGNHYMGLSHEICLDVTHITRPIHQRHHQVGCMVDH